MLTLFRFVLLSSGGAFWLHALVRLVRYQEQRDQLVATASPYVPLLDAFAERAVVDGLLYGFAAFFGFAVLTMMQRRTVAEAAPVEDEPAAPAVRTRATTRIFDAMPAEGAAVPRPVAANEPADWTDTRWGWRGKVNGRDLYLMEAGAGRYRLWLCYVDGAHIGSFKSRTTACAAAERAAWAA